MPPGTWMKKHSLETGFRNMFFHGHAVCESYKVSQVSLFLDRKSLILKKIRINGLKVNRKGCFSFYFTDMQTLRL